MSITKEDDDFPCKIKLCGSSLDNVHTYTYLGVIVDNDLSFQQFADDKYNKVNFRVYQLKRIRLYINSDIVCPIYKKTTLPLDYGDFMVETYKIRI